MMPLYLLNLDTKTGGSRVSIIRAVNLIVYMYAYADIVRVLYNYKLKLEAKEKEAASTPRSLDSGVITDNQHVRMRG